MGAKTNKDLQAKSAQELIAHAAQLKNELFEMNFKHATRQLGDLMSLRKTRREIARALTLATQKQANGAK